MSVPLRHVVKQVTAAPRGKPAPFVALEHVQSLTGQVMPSAIIDDVLPSPAGMIEVQKGDVLFGKLRPYLAKSLHVSERTFVSSEFIAMRPLSQVDGRYLRYLVMSGPFIEWAIATSEGVKMPRARWETLGALALRLPGLQEQQAIADFLDAETARIDSLIQLRYRMRVLGTERHRTSLDELFRSEAWPAQKLKHLLRAPACYGVLVPRFVQSDGIRFIRVNDLADLDVRGPDLVQIEMEQSREYRRTLVQAGDVLTSVVGSIDKAALVTADLTGCNIARAVARLRPRADVSGDLLLAWLRTSDYQRQARLATGSDTAQPTLNMGDLANFRIRWPPPDQVVRALGMIARTDRWQAASDVALRRQIDLLRERRQALITAAVTGEIDVSTASGRGVPA